MKRYALVIAVCLSALSMGCDDRGWNGSQRTGKPNYFDYYMSPKNPFPLSNPALRGSWASQQEAIHRND